MVSPARVPPPTPVQAGSGMCWGSQLGLERDTGSFPLPLEPTLGTLPGPPVAQSISAQMISLPLTLFSFGLSIFDSEQP